MVKRTFLGVITAIITLTSCQNAKQDKKEEYQVLSEEAIEVHDEIMPQISKFDKTSVKIDSILSNLAGFKAVNGDLDTTDTRANLKALQTNIDSASDFMMEWMRAYDPDSADVAYQKSEIERINLMKKRFDEVNEEINTKLKDFN